MIKICKHPSPLAPKKRWIRIFKVLTLTIAITVISDTEYYTITWKNNKKALLVRRVVDPVGTELIGKRFLSNEFNAAIPFQRTIKKTGLVTTELYKFDRKVGFCKNWHENLITMVIIEILLLATQTQRSQVISAIQTAREIAQNQWNFWHNHVKGMSFFNNYFQYVKIAQIYPKEKGSAVRNRDPYQEVRKLFPIDNWCPDSLGWNKPKGRLEVPENSRTCLHREHAINMWDSRHLIWCGQKLRNRAGGVLNARARDNVYQSRRSIIF